jgi:hypothetical protein
MISSDNGRIMKLQKENGIFIIFCEYPYEDDFQSFLDFIKERLGVTVGPIEEIVYILVAELRLDDKIFEAMCQGEAGCLIKVESNLDAFADEIIKKCS